LSSFASTRNGEGRKWPLVGGWIGDRAQDRVSVLAPPRTGSGAN
jgi:hypothetical protein